MILAAVRGRVTGRMMTQRGTRGGSVTVDAPPQTARATAPSPGQPTPGVVKQDKSSGGSVDTTKTRSGPQRVRMSSGERPIGAAKSKQSDTEALCQTPPRPLGPRLRQPRTQGRPGLVRCALHAAIRADCVYTLSTSVHP